MLIHNPENLDFVFKNEGLFTKGEFVKRRSWDLFGETPVTFHYRHFPDPMQETASSTQTATSGSYSGKPAWPFSTAPTSASSPMSRSLNTYPRLSVT